MKEKWWEGDAGTDVKKENMRQKRKGRSKVIKNKQRQGETNGRKNLRESI